MRKHHVLVSILMIGLMFFCQLNCATILDGSKSPSERTGNIQWGYFVLDVLIGGGVIGLAIDFGTGAIYERAGGSRSEIENRLREHAMDGVPCYRVSDDGIYKVEFNNGKLIETGIDNDDVPPFVLQTIERQRQSLTASR